MCKVVDAIERHGDEHLKEMRAQLAAISADPIDSHWRATIGSTVLSRRTAYGWAQAFEVPSSGGRLLISFHDTRRHALLWGELAAVVVVALLALPTGRRPESEEAA